MEDVIGAEALNSMTNPQVALRVHLTNEINQGCYSLSNTFRFFVNFMKEVIQKHTFCQNKVCLFTFDS